MLRRKDINWKSQAYIKHYPNLCIKEYYSIFRSGLFQVRLKHTQKYSHSLRAGSHRRCGTSGQAARDEPHLQVRMARQEQRKNMQAMSLSYHFKQLVLRSLKKFRASTGFEPVTSANTGAMLYQLSYEATH